MRGVQVRPRRNEKKSLSSEWRRNTVTVNDGGWGFSDSSSGGCLLYIRKESLNPGTEFLVVESGPTHPKGQLEKILLLCGRRGIRGKRDITISHCYTILKLTTNKVEGVILNSTFDSKNEEIT